jgi:peroxiredoxin Q/BCP
MKNLKEGDKAPYFELESDNGQPLSLKDLSGQKFILYFYPKDNTPGCTKESCAFRDSISEFNNCGIKVIGVSRDSIKSHKNFIKKFNLNFPLLSDTDGKMCEDFGVWVEKSMYGKKYMGIERTTFLINENGIIQKIWQKVKVEGHVEDILATIAKIDAAA